MASSLKESYTYKTIGDHEIKADVYRAPGNMLQPCIIWIHGGCLIFGSREWISPDHKELYLGAGFTVIAIDYRFAPETKLPLIVEDLQDAYQWVYSKGEELLGVDPDRIAVVGHSAGGYLALMSGVCCEPSPKAIVSFYGYGEIAGSWYSNPDPYYNARPLVSEEEAFRAVGERTVSGPLQDSDWNDARMNYYVHCRQRGIWPHQVTGRDPRQEPDWFRQFSPLHNISFSYPPTLMLHGGQDTDVPVEQSKLLARELERVNVPHELILNSSWGHSFDGEKKSDPAVKDALSSVLRFLRANL